MAIDHHGMLNIVAPPTHNRSAYLIAALAGAANVFAFAPFGAFFIPMLTIALLLKLIGLATPKHAARLGFAFGAAWFAGGMYWLYISLHDFGQAPVLLAVIIMLCLIAIMAAYYALFAWLVARFAPRMPSVRLLLFVPALWTLLEWTRGWFLSGFPWFALGYAQTDNWLAGYAPVAGVFGVSLVVMLLAGALALLTERGRVNRGVAIVMLLVVVAGGWLLQSVEWTRAAGEPVNVALMQGNVAQDKKWLPEMRVPTMQRYWRLTEESSGADLVIWPEAAIPALYWQLDEGFYRQVEDGLLSENQRLLTGTLVHELERDVYFNSAVVLGGDERRFYHKRHLVPFGEYFPVPDFVREWLRLMNLPYSDFETGTDGSALKISSSLSVAVMICYEAVFGEEVITALPEAELLVNISNDGWFGRSIGPLQHFQISRMRAIETGRWLLRATNTGVTAVVDHNGRVLERLPQFETAVLRADVQPREGATPYVRYGNVFVVLIALLLLAAGGLVAFRERR
ncbi:MAG TPA: apolipoprotein N-acyltransferase [Gammaproteobacteria bacterium]